MGRCTHHPGPMDTSSAEAIRPLDLDLQRQREDCRHRRSQKQVWGQRSGVAAGRGLYYSGVDAHHRLRRSLTSVHQVFSNLVNYKSFGFTKIVPRCSESAFAAVISSSPNAQAATDLWNEVCQLSCSRGRDSHSLCCIASWAYLSGSSRVGQLHRQAFCGRNFELLSWRTDHG